KGIMGESEREYILHYVILERPDLAINVKAPRLGVAWLALDAAVRAYGDHWRQQSGTNRDIQARCDLRQKRCLILGETVEPEDERIALPGIELRRQVNIHVAALPEGCGPDSSVHTVIGSVVDDLAVKPLVDRDEFGALLSPTGGVGPAPGTGQHD